MSSLLAERGPIHVHVGATLIAKGRPPPFDRLVEHVERRLALVPRFRQRVTPDALDLNRPVWADDPVFDATRHVRRAALPEPGGMAELRELVGRIMSEPLDPSRPLWQLYLVEGLGGGHALVNKTHHALVDGVAALDVGTAILDASPDGAETEAPDEPWEAAEPSREALLARAATDWIRAPVRAARRAAAGALTTPASTVGRVVRTAESFAELAASGPTAPRTFLNREIGRDRRVAFVATDLEALKAARGEGGATVNDVILSVAAGGLRRLFERRREPLPERLVALVPMSVRRPGDEGELGNRIATLLVALPIGERDPLERLSLISAETARLKASEQARAASLVIEASGWTPPTVNRILADAISRPLSWNLTVSNVPGPQIPLYVLGRRIEAIYPFVPLSPQQHALSIGVLSYNGGVFFGLAGDRDLLFDIEALGADLEAALAEQCDATGAA